MRRRWPALLIAVLLATAAGLAGAADFLPSPEERQRVSRGDVAYRSGAAPRDGVAVAGARGGIAFVRVPTPAEPIWAILTTPTHYPEIFSGLRTVEILDESPGTWLLRMDGKFGPFTFRYHSNYRIQPETRTIAWRLDLTRDNDAFDDHWGWWRLVPEEGGTLVVYASGSVASSWQPLAGFFERRGVVQALEGLRDAAVRRGRAAKVGGRIE